MFNIKTIFISILLCNFSFVFGMQKSRGTISNRLELLKQMQAQKEELYKPYNRREDVQRFLWLLNQLIDLLKKNKITSDEQFIKLVTVIYHLDPFDVVAIGERILLYEREKS